MKKTLEQKLAAKRAAWLERTMAALDVNEATALALLSQERQQSLRINTLRIAPGDALTALTSIGWQGAPVSWAEHCYSIDAGSQAVRDSELVASGTIFVQNAASWLPVLALAPEIGERILDVCAAPGGKTSHIAAITNNQADIWANDNSRPRFLKMQASLRRLGVATQRATLFDAIHLARKLEGEQFDKILLDAPCSGEGLMRYSHDKDFATWSVAHIKRLQQLQKRIIIQAWQLLKPGGTLVYSTCTMAPEESEGVINYLLRTRPEATIVPYQVNLSNRLPALTGWHSKAYNPTISGCLRLAPSPTVEAFFVCKLQKSGQQAEDML